MEGGSEDAARNARYLPPDLSKIWYKSVLLYEVHSYYHFIVVAKWFLYLILSFILDGVQRHIYWLEVSPWDPDLFFFCSLTLIYLVKLSSTLDGCTGRMLSTWPNLFTRWKPGGQLLPAPGSVPRASWTENVLSRKQLRYVLWNPGCYTRIYVTVIWHATSVSLLAQLKITQRHLHVCFRFKNEHVAIWPLGILE